MEEKVKILWVHDNFGQPINGLAVCNDQKVWFRKVADNDYELLQLDDKVLDAVEKNHDKYCLATGAPKFHGDPITIKRKSTVRKVDLSQYIKKEEDGVEVDKRALVNMKNYSHDYDPDKIRGLVIKNITADDFSNLYIPHRVKID